MKKYVIFLLSVSFFAVTSFKEADCKKGMKGFCMQKLKPFVHNGQFNSLSLLPGESISTNMSFYAGHTYRIVTCNETQLGGVYFEIKTLDDQVLYSSKDKANIWDFTIERTANLKVDVYSGASSDPLNEGCVGLLIGFKD